MKGQWDEELLAAGKETDLLRAQLSPEEMVMVQDHVQTLNLSYLCLSSDEAHLQHALAWNEEARKFIAERDTTSGGLGGDSPQPVEKPVENLHRAQHTLVKLTFSPRDAAQLYVVLVNAGGALCLETAANIDNQLSLIELDREMAKR